MAATAETSTRRSLRQQPRIKNGDVVYALFDAPAADGGPYWASALVLSTCGDKGSPSGMVVSSFCVNDFIKKEMLDPFTDPPTKLKEKDLIALRVEGTGFAAKTDTKALKVQKLDGGGGGGW